jgi:hypothetical protein
MKFLSILKPILAAAAFALAATPVLAADVAVSIAVGEPGFYGRIDLGSFPPPVLVNPQPLVIQAAPVGVVRQPIYLYVPPGHAKDWRKHCRKYDACGYPVYFVQDRWYNDVYVPAYREQHGKGHDKKPPKGKGPKHD